jgi:S1-C subfamily serine protease
VSLRRLAIAGAAFGLATALGGRSALADGPTLAQHLDEKAPTLVTLKVVSGSASGEVTRQIAAVVVDPSGLVLCSASRLPAKPSSLHVLFGNDPTENPAVVVARDTITSLAFLQVLELPGGKALAAVDLASGADPAVGQSLFGVTRLGRGFDYAPILKRLMVTAKLAMPRTLFDFEGDFGERGLPVFDLSGRPVGVISDQAAAGTGDKDEIFVWPLKDVLQVLEQAKKRVPDAVAKAKENKDDAKKDEPKDGEAPKDGTSPMDGEGPMDGDGPADGEKPPPGK